jgi:hypothetical protein
VSGRKYSDDFKSNALEVYANVGLNEAARRVGTDKKTILRWAAEAGVDPPQVAADVIERNTRASRAAAARRTRDMEESRERMTKRLAHVSEAGLVRELEVLTAGGFSKEDLQALTNARQKAIQQFELLEGRATTRTDYGQEQLLEGVALAFQGVLTLIGERAIELIRKGGADALQDAVSAMFADALRNVREQEKTLALEAGAIEDGDFEETEAV